MAVSIETGFLASSLIRSSPVYHLGRFLSANHTSIGNRFLLIGNTTGSNSGVLFQLIFTLSASTPHCPYKARLLIKRCHQFIQGLRIRSSFLLEGKRTRIHLVLHGFQNPLHFSGKSGKTHYHLLSCISSYQNRLLLLDILGSDFETKRNAAHLSVGKLESSTFTRKPAFTSSSLRLYALSRTPSLFC